MYSILAGSYVAVLVFIYLIGDIGKQLKRIANANEQSNLDAERRYKETNEGLLTRLAEAQKQSEEHHQDFKAKLKETEARQSAELARITSMDKCPHGFSDKKLCPDCCEE